ncbi:sulfur carrier protein ThiS [Azospirillum sp.]|uniref:sulfur carrier protein ThiS n=1 Tax=Azospirillum sp. TaxID=34012 RepID=UPI002D4D8C48|nr:sulfur carrier protein ThiS [Azospirillum sp.]HYD69785.1 sulfur carrier protein ThiS [Azospirillum sp.]
MPTIRLNGAEAPLTARTLAELMAELLPGHGIAQETRGVAVARNGAVVPRRAWDTTALEPGDTLEIVRPLQGG